MKNNLKNNLIPELPDFLKEREDFTFLVGNMFRARKVMFNTVFTMQNDTIIAAFDGRLYFHKN